MTAALTEDKPTAEENSKNTVVYNDVNKTYSYTVDLKQKKTGWQTSMTEVTIGGVAISGTPTGGTGTAVITYTAGTNSTDGNVTVAVK